MTTRRNPLLLLLNGPPSSGKDTAASFLRLHIAEAFGFVPKIDRLSAPLKASFAAILDIDAMQQADYESNKEVPIPLLSSKQPTSYRKFQIDVSEFFMKPRYGQDIFSKLFLLRFFSDTESDLVIVPDCGFQHEINYIYSHVPHSDILLITLTRPRFDFSNDSREFVKAPHNNITYNIANDASISLFENILSSFVSPWLAQRT